MTIETTLYFRHPSNPQIAIEPTTIVTSLNQDGHAIIVGIHGGGLKGAGSFDGFAKREGTVRDMDELIPRSIYLENPGLVADTVAGWYVRIITPAGVNTTYPYPILSANTRVVPDLTPRDLPTEGEITTAVEQLRQGIELGLQGEVAAGMDLVAGTYATIEAALVPKAWDRNRARRYVLNVCGSYEIQQVFDVDSALAAMFATAGGWDIQALGLEKLDAILEQFRKDV